MTDPAEPRVFTEDIAELLAPHLTEDEDKALLAERIGVPETHRSGGCFSV